MGYLRLVHSAPRAAVPDDACIEAFNAELNYLFETLRRLGAPPRDVEDLVQEVFVVLHRNWSTLDLARPLRPYLFGVAFRIVSAHRRRRGRELPYAFLEVEDGAATPDALLQSKQSTEILHRALEHVPHLRRVVLVMHDLDSVPIADVAKLLSISRFGAYARLRKARKELATAVRRLRAGRPE